MRSIGPTRFTGYCWACCLFDMRTLLALLIAVGSQAAVRLKDIASFEGMRDNQLVGYGLVVGLNGTGDKKQSVFSAQSLANMLQKMGVTIDPLTITVKNTAAVIVTATLPAFAQPGTRIDVTAAAIGDCSNLQGGLLVLTSLRAPNGQAYAEAQGSVITAGFSVGKAGTSLTVKPSHRGARSEWSDCGKGAANCPAFRAAAAANARGRLYHGGASGRGN